MLIDGAQSDGEIDRHSTFLRKLGLCKAPMSNAISQLIAVLQSARLRTKMYFQPVEPKAVENWISGLRAGCSIFGLDWSPEDRRPALTKRTLELLTTWETERLARRGLGPEEIVDELLAIEIEMWQRRGERTS